MLHKAEGVYKGQEAVQVEGGAGGGKCAPQHGIYVSFQWSL